MRAQLSHLRLGMKVVYVVYTCVCAAQSLVKLYILLRWPSLNCVAVVKLNGTKTRAPISHCRPPDATAAGNETLCIIPTGAKSDNSVSVVKSTHQEVCLATEALTCSVVGDENAYIKHLRKLAAADTDPAPALLAAYNWARNLRPNIESQITEIRILGNETLADLLVAVLALPSLTLVTHDVWGTCCVTGVMSTHVLRVQTDKAVFHVDHRFAFFLYSLWTTANLCTLERNRIMQIAAQYTSGALSDRIAQILADNKAETVRLCQLYSRAIDFAQASLAATIRRLTRQVESV